jgi:hypothetical protein
LSSFAKHEVRYEKQAPDCAQSREARQAALRLSTLGVGAGSGFRDAPHATTSAPERSAAIAACR